LTPNKKIVGIELLPDPIVTHSNDLEMLGETRSLHQIRLTNERAIKTKRRGPQLTKQLIRIDTYNPDTHRPVHYRLPHLGHRELRTTRTSAGGRPT
jgi:hypothetical protein